MNSNEHSNEMLLQDVCFCFLFTVELFYRPAAAEVESLHLHQNYRTDCSKRAGLFFCLFLGRVNIF